MRKLLICCLLLVAFGLLDCVTTVVGITFFGAKENNPILVSTTETNLLAFTGIKLAAVISIGAMFYNAGKFVRSGGSKLGIGGCFFTLTYSLSLLTLVFAVSNNVMVVARLV